MRKKASFFCRNKGKTDFFQRRQSTDSRRSVKGASIMKMNPHYFLCLLRSGYFSPHRHKSAPHTKTLNQTIIITRLPYVQKQLSRVQPLYIRFLHRKQIQIHTIIKTVTRVPTMFLYLSFQYRRFFLKGNCYIIQIQTAGQVCHSL